MANGTSAGYPIKTLHRRRYCEKCALYYETGQHICPTPTPLIERIAPSSEEFSIAYDIFKTNMPGLWLQAMHTECLTVGSAVVYVCRTFGKDWFTIVACGGRAIHAKPDTLVEVHDGAVYINDDYSAVWIPADILLKLKEIFDGELPLSRPNVKFHG